MTHSGQSILVVGGLSETTEVLKAVFEPRGHAVRRIRESDLPLNSATQPGVVVWHDLPDSSASCETQLNNVPRIVIGKSRMLAGNHQFSQPFEYGDLLQAIDSALHSADAASC